MSLNKEDASRVGYKAKIQWYKERFSGIVSGEKIEPEPTTFLSTTSTPDELIEILGDLGDKADKLDARIDGVSEKLSIPVDKEKQPDIAEAVAKLDSESKGEYITYDLYRRLLAQQQAAQDNIEISDIINNSTGDPIADSLMIQESISAGLASYEQPGSPTVSKDDNLKRYANDALNSIFSWNEHNYNIKKIIDFSDNYLEIFLDPAYIPWRFKQGVIYEKTTARSLGEFWQNFSKHFESKKNKMVGGVQNLTALSNSAEPHDITKRAIEYGNNFLNSVNNIFDMNYGADLICCFVKWSGGLDIKSLRGMRALLQLFSTGLGLDFNGVVNNIIDVINNIFRGILTHNLVALVTQIFQRLVDPIKKWIYDPDPRWRKIFMCTPIDELVNIYLVDSIEYVQRLLTNLIRNWYRQVELNKLKQDLRVELIGRQKWIGILMKMLDTVISALERSAICGTESSPTGEDIQRLMNAYGVAPEKAYEYPEEEKPNIYNSFISKTPEEGETSLGGEFTTKNDTEVKTMGIGMTKEKFNECLKKFVPGDVVPITEWFDEIKAKSQGSGK